MTAQPLIDGVERVRVAYGVDDDLDGVADAFINATNMTQAYWDNESSSRILAVKIYVLVRDILPDPQYENEAVYQMGDFLFDPPNDNFRRMLFSTTVTLHNGDVQIWQ